VNSRNEELFRFSLRGLLVTTTVCAVAAGLSVVYPNAAFLTAFGLIFLAMHFPEPFLRYFPRTTLLCFLSVGAAFIVAAVYGCFQSGGFDYGFFGRMCMGGLFLLMTLLSYYRTRRGEF
jgi:hypothetical protein